MIRSRFLEQTKLLNNKFQSQFTTVQQLTNNNDKNLKMASHNGVADENPPQINPYEVLGIEKTASEDEIKRAYRKSALKHHPGML